MKKQGYSVLFFLFILICPSIAYAQGDAFPIHVPNVMVILDTSSSMEMSMELDPSGNSLWTTAYGPHSPDGVYNFRKDGNHPSSRLYQAKKTIRDVFHNVMKGKEVNLGFATYAQVKVPRVRGRYRSIEAPEAWKRRKRYYAWTKNEFPVSSTSAYGYQFLDEWGAMHGSLASPVRADPLLGTEFTRVTDVHDDDAIHVPLHPLLTGGSPERAKKRVAVTYRVTGRTKNPETDIFTFTYKPVSENDWIYEERFFYDTNWQTDPGSAGLDCREDRKNHPWPETQNTGGITWYSHFSNDSDPTEYNTPSGGRGSDWWQCVNGMSGSAALDENCHRSGSPGGTTTPRFAWFTFEGTTCPPKHEEWIFDTKENLCLEDSGYRYTPEPNNENRPHTWSYYRITGETWKNGSADQPDPYYPAAEADPGEGNNHTFFLNFPDDKDSGFVPTKRTDHFNKILSYMDLTPVLNVETNEYWTKLPVHRRAGKQGLTANTEAFDSQRQSPLADTLHAAFVYFNDYINRYICKGCTSPGDPWSKQTFGGTRCRGNYVILLTDGLESARYLDSPANRQVDDLAAATEAENLYKIHVQTFAVGFGQEGLQNEGLKALNLIARKGSGNRRDAYFPGNPDQLYAAMQEIFMAILNESFSRSNPVVAKTGDRIFRSYFEMTNSGEWKGFLEARLLNSSGEIINPPPGGPSWEAGKNLVDFGRGKVYSWTGNSPNPPRIEFKATEGALYGLVSSSTDDINGDGRYDDQDARTVIQFTLDPGHDGGRYKGYRARDWKLGDIYHSTPVVIAAPPSFSPDPGYRTFYEAFKNREPMIYVGANDGMLHAFRALDGREVFSIIPKNLLSRLKNLKTIHDFYVDSTPKATDAFFREESKWKTLVLTGQRGGGPYYFAIDVTDPRDSDYPKILWEWTDTDTNPAVGETWGKPEVGKVRYLKGSMKEDRFVAFLPGGYSTADHVGNSFHIVDLETGTTLKRWTQLGSSGNKIPAGATAIDCTGTGYATYVYFGDTDGRIWKIDLTDTDSSKWSCKVFFEPEAGKRKPIYYPPAVIKNDANRILILIGSGDEMNIKKPGPSYLYEIEDTGSGAQLNWVKELIDEKIVEQPVVANYVVYFTTWKGAGETENCGMGSGKLYGLKVSNSAAPGGTGALVLLDTKGDPVNAKESIQLGRGVPTKPIVTNGVIYVSSSISSKGYFEYPGRGDSAFNMGPRGIQFIGWPASRIRAWREVF